MKSFIGEKGRGLPIGLAVIALSLFVVPAETGRAGDKTAKPIVQVGGPEAGFGNAEGIGGGDAIDTRVAVAVKDVVAVLRSIGDRPEYATQVCSVQRCPIGLQRSHCERVVALKGNQRKDCQGHIARLVKRFGTGVDLPIHFASGDLTVGSGASKRSVAASTSLAVDGPLVFARDRVTDLSRDELVALIAHELGHKVPLDDGRFVTDDGRVGAFPTGRGLLDAVGTAVAVFSQQVRVPLQAAPEVAAPQRAAFCAGKDPFFASLTLDVEGAPRSALEASRDRFLVAREILTGERGRHHWISQVVTKYFGRSPSSDEKTLLTISLSQGGSEGAVLASVLSDPEYLNARRLQSAEDFLAHVYQELLGRGPVALELARGVEILKVDKRPAFLVRLIESDPNVLAGFVQGWYRRYLNRDPEGFETSALVARLRAGEAWESVQAEILASSEYLALQGKRRQICSGN